MERGSRKRSSNAGSEKLERVGKNGTTFFDRPKPPVDCSANGRGRRRRRRRRVRRRRRRRPGFAK